MHTKQATVIETIVTPARGGRETFFLLSMVAVTLVCCALAIGLRTTADMEKTIQAWQFNAFEDLTAPERAVFNALQIASDEINDIHASTNHRWMDIAELQALFIPPFVEDAAWHNQGRIIWSQKTFDTSNGERHIALYLGNPQTKAVRGTFLLLMLHDHPKKQGNVATGPTHAPYEIWLHNSANQTFPEIITDQALIAAGWKEIVALTGADEIQRLKETTIQ